MAYLENMSSAFTEHVHVLHDGLKEFMDGRAFSIGRGCMIGTGLLLQPARQIECSGRMRLLVVSGLFSAIAEMLPENIPDTQDVLIAGLLRSNSDESRFTHLGVVSTTLALDLLHRASPPHNLAENDIIKLSHSIRLTGPSDMSASDAEWLYQKVITQTLP